MRKNFQNFHERGSVAHLHRALAYARVCSFDWETTPTTREPVGLGIFTPENKQAFYINVGHKILNPKFPRTPLARLLEAIAPFFSDANRLAVAHNILFDAAVNCRAGIKQRCRLTDAMILQHRLNENFSKAQDDPSEMALFEGRKEGIGYGLKMLMQVRFRIQPITYEEVVGGLGSIALVDPERVATYCMNDCINGWKIHQHAVAGLSEYPCRLIGLDSKNLSAVLRMLSNGIPVDVPEVEHQIDVLTQNAAGCTEEIYKILGRRPDLSTKASVTAVLQTRGCLPADPKDERRLLYAHLTLAKDRFEKRRIIGKLRNLSSEGPLSRKSLIAQIEGEPNPDNRRILALLVARNVAEQRLTRFLKPILERHMNKADNRIYVGSFLSITATTRYTCKPNFQSLPKRADELKTNKVWVNELPKPLDLGDTVKTRKVIAAKPGNILIAADLSNAEPRYAACKMEAALHDKGARIAKLRKQQWLRSQARYPDLFDWSNERRTGQTEPIEEILYPEIEHDQLWEGFQIRSGFPKGDDPYERIASLLSVDRSVAKQLWLSVIYGVGPDTIATNINKTAAQAEQLIDDLYTKFPMIDVIQEETRREMLSRGMVETLWGRPRRIQGFYQLAQGDECDIVFERSGNKYRATIIPLGLLRWGVHCFVKECWRTDTNVIVLKADRATKTYQADGKDPFVSAEHFALPPFRNPSYSGIQTVIMKDGVTYPMPLMERAFRQAFNAIFQGTGADHMRWLMNKIDRLLLQPRFSSIKLLLTIHDELLFECPNDEAISLPFMAKLKQIITTRPDWATVPILTEVTSGLNYGEMKKVEIP